MGLRFVNFVMNPSPGLLYADGPPFLFGEQFAFGKFFHDVFGQNDMPVLVCVVFVLF
jgi:hypothetical protein